MFEAAVNEFPFVETLPKREKNKLAKLWDRLREFQALREQEGDLLSLPLAAKLLDISHQRVCQLCEAGHLKRVDFEGHGYITQQSLLDRAQSERQSGGRPRKVPSAKEVWTEARKQGRQVVGQK